MEQIAQVISIYSTGNALSLSAESLYFDPAGLHRSHHTYPSSPGGALALLERLAVVLGLRAELRLLEGAP